MTFKKRRIEGLTSAAPVVIGTAGLSAPYGRVVGFRARNWASSAKAGAGADTAGRIELKDVDGVIFFLDAADVDYATAEVRVTLSSATDTTGLGTVLRSQTGTAYAAGAGNVVVVTAVGEFAAVAPMPAVHGPITLTARNFATVTDFLTVDLLVEI